MSTPHSDIPWLEPCFFENQKKFPPEELEKYAGQHIAWSWDGSRILASAPEEAELYQKLQDAGVDANRVVLGYVDPL
jgi:hypothetical protein